MLIASDMGAANEVSRTSRSCCAIEGGAVRVALVTLTANGQCFNAGRGQLVLSAVGGVGTVKGADHYPIPGVTIAHGDWLHTSIQAVQDEFATTAVSISVTPEAACL